MSRHPIFQLIFVGLAGLLLLGSSAGCPAPRGPASADGGSSNSSKADSPLRSDGPGEYGNPEQQRDSGPAESTIEGVDGVVEAGDGNFDSKPHEEHADSPPEKGREGKCSGRASHPPKKVWTMEHDGRKRRYHVITPPGYDPGSPTPLVLNFHGHTGWPERQMKMTGMNSLAQREGFILVYPEGSGTPRSWNAGGCCPLASTRKIDDVGFIRAMLSRLRSNFCIDPRRIFACGSSNGGMLAYRLACEQADTFAAVAVVSGALAVKECRPSRPVSVLHFHGTSDRVVPPSGSRVLNLPSVAATIETWTKVNGCAEKPDGTWSKGEVSCSVWSKCQKGADVTLCLVEKGGHTWPGGDCSKAMGYTTRDVNASERIWRFFEAHPMPKP